VREAGGLSGTPLSAPSTAMPARVHELTGGAVPLIAVGSAASGADAYAKLQASASVVHGDAYQRQT